MTGKLALNLITIKNAPLASQLDIAKRAGYQAVGLWLDRVLEYLTEGRTLTDLARLLSQKGLHPAEMCALSGWMYSNGEVREKAFAQAKQAFAICQELGCDCVVACASEQSGDLIDAAGDFAQLCRMAAPYRMRLALEFLGPAQQVKDLKTAQRIVEMADQPNGGLLVDTYHFYRGRSNLEDLKETPGSKIFLVHLNDCLDLPINELTDLHRVFPGLGVIPLEEMVAILYDIGYRGFYSLEIFNEEYWATDPLAIAKEGVRAWQRLGTE